MILVASQSFFLAIERSRFWGSIILDKRLKIPVCEESYTISFPYKKTNNTVLAECLKSEWRAYIGIKISQQINAYAYTKNMLPGSLLTMQHLTKIQISLNTSRISG